MKKIFIALVVLIILLIVGGILGYFYYDKNLRYGKALNLREIPKSDGFYFDNAISEQQMTFWNPSGNYQVAVVNFKSNNEAEKDFAQKSNEYLQSSQANNWTVSEIKASGNLAFTVSFQKGSLIVIQKGEKIIHIVSSTSTAEKIKKFGEWFIWYQI